MATTTLEPAPAPGARERGGLFWVGLVMVLAGVVLLGYVGWQFFGTNVVAHHRQQAIVDRTEQLWSKGSTTTVARPPKTMSSTSTKPKSSPP